MQSPPPPAPSPPQKKKKKERKKKKKEKKNTLLISRHSSAQNCYEAHKLFFLSRFPVTWLPQRKAKRYM